MYSLDIWIFFWNYIEHTWSDKMETTGNSFPLSVLNVQASQKIWQQKVNVKKKTNIKKDILHSSLMASLAIGKVVYLLVWLLLIKPKFKHKPFNQIEFE